MSSGSAKNSHPQQILDEGDEAFEAKIISRMVSLNASLANPEPLDPMAEKIRDEQRCKTRDLRAKLWGLPIKSDESKSTTFDESVVDITVFDGVVSIKFIDPLLAAEYANEIRDFLKRRLA